MGFSVTPELKQALLEDGVIKAKGLLDPEQDTSIPEGDGLYTVGQREEAGANVENAMQEGDLFGHPGFLQLR